jgi:Zn-dependent protease with chaperone function
MAANTTPAAQPGFVRSFVLPALTIFLVPVLSLAFFLHAQSQFNAMARESILQSIQNDATMTAEQRQEATAFFQSVPVSTLMRDPDFAANFDKGAVFDFATFHWMIQISFWSIAGGCAVLALAGFCVIMSHWSQAVQYRSLVVGWHVLRWYAAAQTIAVGILLVALSFWVTALWMNVYSVKLIGVAAILAVLSVGAIIVAIFRNPKSEFSVEGIVIGDSTSPYLWRDLHLICDKVGTEPPDQVIAGIDDNFFVTEREVKVGDTTVSGKTLFVSLSLLRHLRVGEAEAVLAHEMAHFSGQDTLYSNKVSPLLERYGAYLQGLEQGGITLPAYYFMLCFRALFELSLRKLSRSREFRADGIATQLTSPQDMAGALLRIAAYSSFRAKVENELFSTERVLDSAQIADQIEDGFPDFCRTFADDPTVTEVRTAHPFDTHPPMQQRLAAVGVDCTADAVRGLLMLPPDARWYHNVSDAENLEQQQWDAFEQKFRTFHEQSLPYRFLPASAEEQAVVETAFPALSFAAKDGTLTIDYAKVHDSTWDEAIHFSNIANCTLEEQNRLLIQSEQGGKRKHLIAFKRFEKSLQREILDAFQRYYGRHLAAVAWHKQKESVDAKAEPG